MAFKDVKVLILGLGINEGGLGATKFFAKNGSIIRVTDLKTEAELKASINKLKKYKNIEFILGKHREEDIDWADLIIRNPAIKPSNKYLTYAQKKGKKIEMDIGIFIQFVNKDNLICVTGTKGKSTTSSLIYQMIKTSGKNVIFGGNIGKSVLDLVSLVKNDTLIVLETSSFQLQAFREHKFSPKFALITNIYPDHLNYHLTMKEYIKAKRAIAEFQTKNDFIFLNKLDKLTSKKSFRNGLKGQLVEYTQTNLKSNLIGKHNLQNIAGAVEVAKKIGIADNDIKKALADFKGNRFRTELVYDNKGLKIYNDSAATNPEATIQALESFPNAIFIIGGVNKNLPYKMLAQKIKNLAKKVYFLEGDATDEIQRYLKLKKIKTYTNLKQLLKDIQAELKEEELIIFSPGAASFNLFKNEFDRGEKFNKAVKTVFLS